MALQSITSHWRWSGRELQNKFSYQVVPGQKPGAFIARIIVRQHGIADPTVARALSSMPQTREILSYQVFFDGGGHIGSLPQPLQDALQSRDFPSPVRFSPIESGTMPENLRYPFWVGDKERSMLIIDGRYFDVTPLTSEFIPTLNCIFRCTQCSYRHPKEMLGIWQDNDFSPQFHMDIATMRTLLQQLRNGGVRKVLFTGGGEPLLNADTPSAMDFARHDMGLDVALYTNGALIKEKTARRILSANPEFVRISLNAGRKTVYNSHHMPIDRKNYFASVIKGLRYLARIKAQTSSATKIGVSYLIHPDNADDLVDGARVVAEIAKEIGAGSINFMRFTPSINYWGGEQHPSELFALAIERVQKEAVPILEAAGVSPKIYRHRFEGLKELRNYSNCLGSSWYGEVGPGGILYHCCEKIFIGDFAIGSLLDSSLFDLWYSKARQRVLDFARRSIGGETNSPCPPLCKPHELSKVFAIIEDLRGKGQIELVKMWLNTIWEIMADNPKEYTPGPLDGFGS